MDDPAAGTRIAPSLYTWFASLVWLMDGALHSVARPPR
jgi:hypothetical protein